MRRSCFEVLKFLRKDANNTFGYIYHTNKNRAAVVERLDWAKLKSDYQPVKYTLDWSFMNDLPPGDVGPLYGWYQTLLNVKVAALFKEYDLEFLSRLKKRPDWNYNSNRTTSSLLQAMEEIAPGIIA